MEVLATVTDPRIVEASGLAASRAHPGSFWVHNDSGGVAELYRLGGDGAVVEVLAPPLPRPRDWEDLALREVDGVEELVVGDIGDNGRAHPSVWLHLMRPSAPGAVVSTELTYDDGQPRDAEALLVDPADGAAWVLTKSGAGDSELFLADGLGQATGTLRRSGGLDLGALDGDRFVTAADLSADGRWLAVRTYLRVHVWERPEGASLAQTLLEAPCTLVLDDEPQGEAVTWTDEGLVTLSEGVGQPLRRVPWPP